MEIADLITPRSVVAQLRATNKKQALQELAKRAAALTGVPERTIYDVLIERERLGTTGIGMGIGIPHGRLPGLDRLAQGVMTFRVDHEGSGIPWTSSPCSKASRRRSR